MYNFSFFLDNRKPKILCLGAHPDDIEIGCGGTVLRLVSDFPKAKFYWAVFSGNHKRVKEARKSANIFLTGAQSKTIAFQVFKESYFPFFGNDIKDFFEALKQEFSPDLVFTHYGNDAHQDHKLISDLTWNTFRNHLIFEYEIPKYDGDLGKPNLFVYLDETSVERKIKHICEVFKSQCEKQWFSQDTFKSIMRIRGLESNSPSKYAEGFYCRKIVFR